MRKYFDLKLWMTTNFDLKPIETLIYSYYEIKKAWNDFDLVKPWIAVFELTMYFNAEKMGKW